MGPLGERGETQSWAERMERRQAQAKPMPSSTNHVEREEARRRAERAADMERRREDGTNNDVPHFDIGTPRGEAAPNTQMQQKYDRRLLASRRTPAVTRASSAAAMRTTTTATRRGVGDASSILRRESATQIDKKRPRPNDPPTRLRKRRVDEQPPVGRQRYDQGPLGTAPR